MYFKIQCRHNGNNIHSRMYFFLYFSPSKNGFFVSFVVFMMMMMMIWIILRMFRHIYTGCWRVNSFTIGWALYHSWTHYWWREKRKRIFKCGSITINSLGGFSSIYDKTLAINSWSSFFQNKSTIENVENTKILFDGTCTWIKLRWQNNKLVHIFIHSPSVISGENDDWFQVFPWK